MRFGQGRVSLGPLTLRFWPKDRCVIVCDLCTHFGHLGNDKYYSEEKEVRAEDRLRIELFSFEFFQFSPRPWPLTDDDCQTFLCLIFFWQRLIAAKLLLLPIKKRSPS